MITNLSKHSCFIKIYVCFVVVLLLFYGGCVCACVCLYLSVRMGVHMVVQMSEEDTGNSGAGITGALEQSNVN